MTDALRIFRERVAEMEAYCAFIQDVEKGCILLHDKDGVLAYTTADQSSLLITSKAHLFLLLYNLMESSVDNGIREILDQLIDRRVAFDKCCDNIRRFLVFCLGKQNLGKRDRLEKVILGDHEITRDVIYCDVIYKRSKNANKWITNIPISSGNVTKETIVKLSDNYGFSAPGVDGQYLSTVTDIRNDLAHGNRSFSEVGRDYTIERIFEIKANVIAYLDALLTNIAKYIQEQQYLATP